MAENFDEPTHVESHPENAGSPETGTPRRRARRAASRPAGAPTGLAPVTLTATPAATTTAGTATAEVADGNPAAPAEVADAPVPAESSAPKRRQPRRATRAVEAPSLATEPVAAVVETVGGGAMVIADVTPVRKRRNRLRGESAPEASTSELEAPEGESAASEGATVTLADDAPPARRTRRRSRTSEAETAPKVETAPEVEPASEEDAASEKDAEDEADAAGQPDAADQTDQPSDERGARTRRHGGAGGRGRNIASLAEKLGTSPEDDGSDSAADTDDDAAGADDSRDTASAADAPADTRSRRGGHRGRVADAQRVLVDDIFDLFSANDIAGSDDDEEDDSTASDALADLSDSLFQEARPVRRRSRFGAADVVTGNKSDRGDRDQAAREDGEDGEDTEFDAAGDDDAEDSNSRRRRRRGGRGRRGRLRDDDTDDAGEEGDATEGADGASEDATDDEGADGSTRRRRRRRRATSSDAVELSPDDPPNTVVRVRSPRNDEVRALKGSTRLEAKKQRRREGRDASRRKQIITEAEFLARRESVERTMVIRERSGRTQVAVLEDGVLVEHYVARKTQTSMVGNVYLGKVQNVLPSMEAAFVDIGRGRNAVLYAGEVNWDAAGLEGQPRRIESALKPGDAVLVQVTKDPIGHKGARLTSQVSLPGRFIVLVPGGSMTGISRKLPDVERSRLKKILKSVMPSDMGVIVRTAAEGASEEELVRDVERLTQQWDDIQAANKKQSAPAALSREPDLAIKVVRDVFNEDFSSMSIQGGGAFDSIYGYLESVAPELATRVEQYTADGDVFAEFRVDEQLHKALDRNVFLPSGGSLVIDRTEAMTVVDVNTGKFTGSGGTLEETVTKNNLEAAEEIVRQLRLRDIGGIIVVDFIDMVLESNRDLVLRRLVECLSRDRTRHQVAEMTSLGLVQMTRKRVGEGLLEVFSESCSHCNGRGLVMHSEPVEGNHQTHEIAGYANSSRAERGGDRSERRGRRRGGAGGERGGERTEGAAGTSGRGKDRGERANPEPEASGHDGVAVLSDEARTKAKATIASIAAAAAHAHEHEDHAADSAPAEGKE
ncbi:Rne/Rng family ribonuclease [Micrococcales bacterium 31B]|nr:Rne/Rng family ribonuclease [Micrococcales bacterium 31B]